MSIMPSEIVENLKIYKRSKDMNVVNDNEEPTKNVSEKPLKKYRAINYEKDDEDYAMYMKTHEIPQEFRDFTEGLMDETHINRFGLLQAIDDYQRTRPEKNLSSGFQNSAFNYRPYQQCTVS
jgi:hypothetical protein